ncbi:phosphoribosylamine--glycine ligase [Helicobacter suis]|uniref:Phosphoribosylamine--glycine ligase n=3 Tax=Helicobacter suis TaxID=104628 RepID=E7G3E6_9HELI|nr:phosphoribosylamine--glycine ligase [Helicobacter suis]EFX42080.1 phosphoribosylglycinamide synthetase [Helicobacter suis HS5]EFX43234.1 Phosphoribosylamine--glycine ligase [Helicobacter suis HS1]BCD45704.1 Phosphoribosylamine--glycine ligase PurD [Helicobacter suis]BCD48370.1 Phosphoribosylamine--glycine ligase PurD [Helicobacter suis]BCD50146.1 Phosphoribosylamine--glycine ligase PurD [Helicobacter suis]
MKKKILIIGGGAREYALGRKLKEDTRISELYFCPGNGGTQSIGENIPLEEYTQIVDFALQKGVDLVVIGPEEPLVGGLADMLKESGLAVFGPSKKASILEGSKSFTKNLATQYHIPTAPYCIVRDHTLAQEQVAALGFPLVVKVDGLSGGKGVVVVQSEEEYKQILGQLLLQEKHSKVLVEQYLKGFELSIFALVHHQNYLLLPPCHDYKKLTPEGPNTGGMGAFAPSSLCDEVLKNKIASQIIEPALKAMVEAGTPFIGVLYAGIMVVEQEGQLEPYLLEFNVRLGDPECSVLLPLLKTPLLDLLEATLEDRLDTIELELHPQHTLGVVLASKDYPYKISGGQNVYIDPMNEKNAHLDLGKIVQENGVFLVSGGRVCVCVGWGKSLSEAKNHAYNLVKKVQFEGMQFREDIGSL